MFECPVAGGTCVGIPFNETGTGVSVASASPGSVSFGNVPINTTASSTVTINVDAGYRTEVASGSGLNAPFAFDFGSCGTGGGFTGPGTCTVSESYTPTAVGPNSGTTNVFECPVVGGTCIGIPFNESGTGVSAASATPGSVSFGSVPINTTVSGTVTINVDAGYRTEVASGSGLNAPFAFDFGSCGTGGGFTGPGTCTVTERYTPTAVGPNSGTTSVFECPVVGGTCIGIPFSESGTGVSAASATPGSVELRQRPDQHDGCRRTVTINVDAGYRTEVASGSGLNAPFAFDFGSLRHRRWLHRPRQLHGQRAVFADGGRPEQRDDECVRVPHRRRHLYRHPVRRERRRREHGLGQPERCQLRQRPDQHDGFEHGDHFGRCRLQD